MDKLVVCKILDKNSREEVVRAAGKPSRKWSAEAIARRNAIRALKKKLKRHFPLDNYIYVYEFIEG